MNVRIAGTARPASWLVPEIVPLLNSPRRGERIMIQPGLETAFFLACGAQLIAGDESFAEEVSPFIISGSPGLCPSGGSDYHYYCEKMSRMS